ALAALNDRHILKNDRVELPAGIDFVGINEIGGMNSDLERGGGEGGEEEKKKAGSRKQETRNENAETRTRHREKSSNSHPISLPAPCSLLPAPCSLLPAPSSPLPAPSGHRERTSCMAFKTIRLGSRGSFTVTSMGTVAFPSRLTTPK